MHPAPGNVFCHCISESLIMATGSHVESNAEVHRLKQAQPHDLLKRMVCSGDEKNMREDETDQERFPVGRCVHKYSKAKRAVVSKKKTRHSGVGSRACRRSPTASRTSDMANKENELTCADDVQAILYSDNCGFPVNSTDASKMAGAGSKYSDYFTEEEQPCISIGCCVDLLPQVKMILNTKYEEHLIVALHWVQSTIKKWWSELSTNNKSLHDGFSNDRNVQAMKTMLLELWEGKRYLSSVPGTVGETAKVIESYVSQLR
ncbi:KATNB1-like protein 1 [Labeo rohita]|uniref:KATNB1-like protein 1 n=1 Tax=Labeo rohita TaxID=84645 RepID=A0ABQ8LMX9_LABRO|nr:KATNB1-like protein 1 [Labeo rohita]